MSLQVRSRIWRQACEVRLERRQAFREIANILQIPQNFSNTIYSPLARLDAESDECVLLRFVVPTQRLEFVM
jgi:hypothetical protein